MVCAATKRGGYMVWADRVGMKRAPSDSDTGWDGEDRLVGILRARGWEAERVGGVKHPFDIIVEGVLRVDAKSAKFATYKSGVASSSGWYFRIGKVPQADMVILVQLDTGDIYAIPWWDSPIGNITISTSPKGKYLPYLNNFGLVQEMIDSFKKMRETIPSVHLG